MRRTCTTILTWNRIETLKSTLDSFWKYNGECHDILILDNGSTDGTVEWLKASGFDVIYQPKNIGVFTGTMELWKEAHKRGHDFILNLQDDFPCTGPIPFRLIELYLDKNIDVGYIRLNEKQDHKCNIVTEKEIVFEKKEKIGKYKFRKYNYHATFNPCVIKAWMVPIFYTNQTKIRERGLMEKFAQTGLKACRIYPPMFNTLPQRERTEEWIR